MGGTIYRSPEQAIAVEGALVELLDSAGRSHATRSNCAGNFYVRADDFQPVYPLWVKVSFAGESQIMETPIYRDGACASCHFDPAGPDSAGHVFVFEEPVDLPALGCR